MLNKPLVSVITTIYKEKEYLKETIDSILKQTYQNFEVIIVVEKSDNQKEIDKILMEYKDSRIIIINNQKRLGLADSLNLAISNANGKYLARIDTDDINELDRFEKQVDYLENNHEVGILGGAIRYFQDKSGTYTLPTDNEHLKVFSLFSTPLMHPTTMIRKEVFDKYDLKYKTDQLAEDYELWSRVFKYTKIANLKEVLVNYRVHGTNLTEVNTDKIDLSHQQIMDNQLKEYLNLSLTEKELTSINLRISKKNLLKQMLIFNKIYKKNKKQKFYNEKILKKYIINRFKQIVKNILGIK